MNHVQHKISERERHGQLIDNLHNKMHEDVINMDLEVKKLKIDSNNFIQFSNEKITEMD